MPNFMINTRFPSVRHPPIIAAIDLGTNSCRLLIAKVHGNNFRIIDSFSRVVRLGEGVHASDLLHQDAMDRAVEALHICKQKISQNHVYQVRAVTTEACRRAQNSQIFLDRVANEVGLTIEVISTAEEARLALAGCAGVLNSRIPYALAFDIGGGSTEVMWLRINEPRRIHRRRAPIIEVIDYTSIPYGVVTLSDAYHGNITPKSYEKIRQEISHKLMMFSEKNDIQNFIERQRVQMIGTSGTVTTLAAIQLGLKRYDRRLIDGVFLNLYDIHNMSKSILNMTTEERVAHPCIGPGRSELVLMGTAILEGICDTWPLNKLRVADRGVREGILMDMIKNINAGNRHHRTTTFGDSGDKAPNEE